ncbi:hypothetical protein [Halobacillus campisalis]
MKKWKVLSNLGITLQFHLKRSSVDLNELLSIILLMKKKKKKK